MVKSGRQKKRRAEEKESEKEPSNAKKIKINDQLIDNKKEIVNEELGNKKEVDERAEEKEKDIIFWVKFGKDQPVMMRTHFTYDRKRELPLTYVSELISAFKNSLDSPLVNIPVQHVTVHTTDNGIVNKKPLRLGDKLSSIPSPKGRTEENPLVIKKSKYLCLNIY